MRYIITSKNGIFYEKYVSSDSLELKDEQLEITQSEYNTIKLPCKLVNGEYIKVNEYPELETKTTIVEPDIEEVNLEDDLAAITIDHEYRLTLLEMGVM